MLICHITYFPLALRRPCFAWITNDVFESKQANLFISFLRELLQGLLCRTVLSKLQVDGTINNVIKRERILIILIIHTQRSQSVFHKTLCPFTWGLCLHP